MKNKFKTPELLSPAGSPEAARAAVSAGADAVYLGGKLLNARINAKNFTDSELTATINFCHKNGVKTYITMNTAVYDKEISNALEYIDFLYKAGADALIVSDLGLARLITSKYPELPLHASTQASGHNTESAIALHKLGFSRMVCAREMSESEIISLCQNSPIEIEQFIHGALCVSQSGQCLASAMIGGRSGNRGECAQPCRMPYNGSYPLSLKDLCLAGHVNRLIDNGVTSLKIEGRMKSPDYVYEVTSVYRKLLDERRNASNEEINLLRGIFSRSGFTDGYYTGKVDGSMCGIRSEKDKQLSKSIQKTEKIRINRSLPEIIINRSNPPSDFKMTSAAFGKNKKNIKPVLTARFSDPRQISGGDFFSLKYLPLEKYTQGVAEGVVLPPSIFERDLQKAKNLMYKSRNLGAEHALICHISQIQLAKDFGFILHGDFRLNIFNSQTAALYLEQGFRDMIVSAELTLPQIRDIAAPKSAVVYGKIPLMLLTNPMIRAPIRKTSLTTSNGGTYANFDDGMNASSPEKANTSLIDRTGAKFPVTEEFGYDIMLNSVPFWMGDKQNLLDEYGVAGRHFIFTDESTKECSQVINDYKNSAARSGGIRRIPLKNDREKNR